MKVIFSLVLFAASFIIPVAFVFAEVKYIPMVGLPRLDPNAQTTEQYVQALFFLSIAAAAILAFVKILFGGVKWMLSGVVTDKASAKKDIQGAIFGLLIVLSAYLVLNTINPRLLELNILQSAPTLGIVGGQNAAVQPITCPAGSNLQVTPQNPTGSCSTVTSSAVPQNVLEGENNTPGNINSYCGVNNPGTTYNPTTKQCERKQQLVQVPESDRSDVNKAREFCFGSQMQYNESTGFCEPYY